MKKSDFYFELPEELIAQHPSKERDGSRLLVLDRRSGAISDRHFRDLPQYISENDALVLNRTRVLPARLFGVNVETGANVEFLLLKRIKNDTWETLVKPGRRAKTGARFRFGDSMECRVGESTDSGGRFVDFSYAGIFEERLDELGHMPLPPYIKQESDAARYQTVYAKESGSAAAPTAGLHFTLEMLESLGQKGVDVIEILLHVGLGTFRPVKAENVEEHKMHSEYYEVGSDVKERISRARSRGGRVFAVGTTSCRTLESVAISSFQKLSGWTDIFITPGFKFQAVDALITNFHLPESTLIMLVSAFAGRENVFGAYEHAIKERYRFYSYGDAMLIL